MLIVCGGINTEPSYFRQFRLTSAQIIVVGFGFSPLVLVERAIEEQQKRKCDQAWVVFDKDDFDDFNNAIDKAVSNGFGVAYSNQAFEYWLILHFEDHQGGAMHRDLYHDKLNGYLKEFGIKYDGKGSKIVTPEIFEILLAKDKRTNLPRIELAIKRAKRNFELHAENSPAKAESSSTVFQLVEKIWNGR